MTLKVYNSLSNQVEEFVPREPGKVFMYNCGPTVYGPPHIGNFRSFLFADLLRRTFEYLGFDVNQIMNITDVGHLTEDDIDEGFDKIDQAARKEGKTPQAIANHWTEEFFAMVNALGLKKADLYPKATDHVQEMIEAIESLVEKGHAYEVNGNLYFEISTFPDYGKLSGNTPEQLQAGARIDVNPDKRHAADFALWKQDEHHLQQWDSPWGRGFPGWHIECSAMAKKYLGLPLDVHTGGEDNIFPHHESEIAQTECAYGETFVNYWMHARHLLVDGKKMSKSLGNFYTVRDILDKGYAPRVLRYALISVHYRQNLNFTIGGLDASKKAIERMENFRRDLDAITADGEHPDVAELTAKAESEFKTALEDDLNVSGALGAMFSWISELNRRELGTSDAKLALDALGRFDSVLGVLESTADEAGGDQDAWVEEMINSRNQARDQKDWGEADRIRDELAAAGVVIKDTSDGTTWHREV